MKRLVILVALTTFVAGCIGTPAQQGATPVEQTPTMTDGTTPTTETDATNETNATVTVRGVISQQPYALGDPKVSDAAEGVSERLRGTTVVVRTVTDGPAALRNRTVLIEYMGLPPGVNTSDGEVGPGRTDIVHLEGTYDRDANRITVDPAVQGHNITIVGADDSVREPPVVGREGDTVSVDLYDYRYDTEPGDNISAGGATIRIEDDETATVTNGSVRYGESLLKLLNGPRVVITERPD